MDEMGHDLRQAVSAARGRPEVRAAVEAVYAGVSEAVARRQPRCEASGRCCRFESYGHRLYVTTLELAVFADAISSAAGPEEAVKSPEGPRVRLPVRDVRGTEDGCRFQVDGLCSVHANRPFGCRMFYCDPEAERWQQAQYEHFHEQLKRAHERLGVAYRYVEWRAALRAVLDDRQDAGR